MKFKSLLCTIALGALAFAACEKPDTPGTDTPAIEPKFENETVNQDGLKLAVSAKVSEFTFVDQATTPVGIWVSSDNGTTKIEKEGHFDAEGSLVKGKTEDLEPAKTYTVGVFVTLNNEKTYSKGVNATICPLKFQALAAVGQKTTLKLSCKLKYLDDTDVEAEKVTEAGLWYSLDNGATKEEVKGEYAAETTVITAEKAELEVGKAYTTGIYVIFDGQKYYSEGIQKTLSNELNPYECSIDMSDKKALNYTGNTKFIDLSLDGTTYKGIRLGSKKNNEYKVGAINPKHDILKLTGNVTLKFYAIADADETLTIELIENEVVEGKNKETVKQTITKELKQKEGWGGDAFDQALLDTDHFTIEFNGLTENSSIRLSAATNIIGLWGIQLEQK